MNARQAEAIVQLLDGIVDVVRDAGDLGAPAGPMYAAFLGHLSLDQFEQLMGALVRSGRLRKADDLYFIGDRSHG